jgi:signal transduction histidine kinase
LRTLAHTESGTLTLQKESTDVAILVNDTAASFAARRQSASIRLDVTRRRTCRSSTSILYASARCSPTSCRTRCSHTPGGGRVAVTVATQPDAMVVLSHRHGSGIPADDLPRIFDRLLQRDTVLAALGWADDCPQPCRAHGGEIHAEECGRTGNRDRRLTLPLPPPHPHQS